MKKLSSFLVKFAFLSFLFFTLLPGIISFTSSEAAASTTVSTSADSNVLVDTMCQAMKIVTGNAGKAFAGFAIISVGIGFFTGKVSWGLMIGVAAGIAAMFGAPSIVSAITGKEVYDCSSS